MLRVMREYGILETEGRNSGGEGVLRAGRDGRWEMKSLDNVGPAFAQPSSF